MKRLIIVLVLCIGVSVSSVAQTLSNKEKRKINYRVLQVIEQYESFMLLDNDDKRTEFGYLFESLDLKIYNDLIGCPTEDNKISVKKYAEYLGKQRSVTSSIKRVSKLSMRQESDGWHTVVSFQKRLRYIDTNGILFSSDEYYNSDYTLIMDIRYDSQKDCCYIAGIDGKLGYGREPLPVKFIVLDKSSETVYKRLYNKTLQYNSYDQAFVRELDESAVSGLDMHVRNTTIAKTPSYEHLKLGYRIAGGRLKARFAATPDQAFKVTTPLPFDKKRGVKSFAWELSVDFGYTLPMGKSSAIGLFVGAGISQSQLSFNLSNLSYSCLVGGIAGSKDDAAVNLHRTYSLTASEGITYTDIITPLYIGFEHRLAKVVSLVWNVGVKAYFNMSANVNKYRITGTIVQEDEHSDIDQTYTSFVSPTSYSVAEPFTLPSISGVGSLGFSFNLYKRRLFASVMAGYEYGLGEIHTSNQSALLNINDGTYPLVPSGKTVTSNVATRSFMDCVSYRRQAWWLEAGLMFKF